jgi:hypothetical protein
MILVECPESSECPRIVAHQDCADQLCSGRLPGIILAHPSDGTSLESRYPFSVGAMYALPRKSSQVFGGDIGVVRPFEDFSERYGRYPDVRVPPPSQPRHCRTTAPAAEFIEPINNEG